MIGVAAFVITRHIGVMFAKRKLYVTGACKQSFSYVLIIVFDSGVVAAHHTGHTGHTGHTANTTVDDVVVERIVSAAEGPTQVILDGLDAEPGELGVFMLRNDNFGTTVGEVVDGHFDNAFGIFHGMVLVKFDVHDVVLLHLGHGMGGDQFGVEAAGHIGQVLEYTLYVDHHGVAGAGDDGQLLLQEGACGWNAVTLQDFVTGHGPVGLGLDQKLR